MRFLAPVAAPAQEAQVHGRMDAALFHFTHDVLRHLRPGARVVAVGLQWAPPWDLLARRLRQFQRHTTLLGGIYIASGVFRPAPATAP